MDTELLNRLLARDEGQFLEFKSAYEYVFLAPFAKHI